MYPLYAQCPHCGFPVVVSGVDVSTPRLCRQCGGKYTPGVPLVESPSPAARRRGLVERQRANLRAQIRERLKGPAAQVYRLRASQQTR